MSKTILARLFLSAGLLTVFSAAAADYQVVSEQTVSIDLPLGELKLTNTVVQEGPAAINRFQMHRLRRPNIPHRGTILLLPSLGNNFRGYLYSEDGNAAKSFAGFFAFLGYDVWGYSPRETGIGPGQCGGALNCAPALQWSMQTVVKDAGYIRGRIRAIHGKKLPVIGGLSMGAISALAVVNETPGDYAGLLAWEGSHVTNDPAVKAHTLPFCNQLSGMVAAGVPVDDQSLPFVKLVAEMARTAPNAPFAIPVPGFPPGLTNRQALVFVLATPNPFAPSPRPGFISAAGDVGSGQLLFSDIDRLTGSIALFNDVTANRVVRDLYCSLAGVETAYSSKLGNFKAPVMIIKAGAGFGSVMDELPAKLGSTAVTFQQIHNFGHIDHLGSPNHAFLLELPVSQWLRQVFP